MLELIMFRVKHAVRKMNRIEDITPEEQAQTGSKNEKRKRHCSVDTTDTLTDSNKRRRHAETKKANPKGRRQTLRSLHVSQSSSPE